MKLLMLLMLGRGAQKIEGALQQHEEKGALKDANGLST